jgi:hypothetical protein
MHRTEQNKEQTPERVSTKTLTEVHGSVTFWMGPDLDVRFSRAVNTNRTEMLRLMVCYQFTGDIRELSPSSRPMSKPSKIVALFISFNAHFHMPRLMEWLFAVLLTFSRNPCRLEVPKGESETSLSSDWNSCFSF